MTTIERPPVLDIRNLTIRTKADGTELVKSLTFSVGEGEVVCVVGESGSGKSLTSLATMGLLDRSSLEVSAGAIEVDGRNVLQLSQDQLREMRATTMSMVFQEPMTALNPVERVGKQIDEVLRIHGVGSARDRKRRVIEMLEAVNLPEPERIYRSYPHQLSGGQRQRIVISMALILKPKLLIADEPTTALDVTTQKQILELILDLRGKLNTAVLFITHDFGVVSEISDRIAVMNKGDLVELGTRDQVLMHPAEPYTRMLISSVPSLKPAETDAGGAKVQLEVDALSKTFTVQRGLFRKAQDIAALKAARFALHQGEIIGIVGESGSGKTTLARCVSRLETPSSGSITLFGSDISKLSRKEMLPHREHLQMVFQDPFRSLNARMRVGDIISEGMVNFGVSRQDAYSRSEELMRLVGLDPVMLERFPHQFSGGQRQRISIARALALNPKVLIADEAVSALDVSVQRQILDLLLEIRARRDVAIIFVTHDLRVAAQICSQIIVMKSGEIVDSGPASKVLQAPDNQYTRDLIASAPGRHWDFANFRPM